MRLSYGLKKFLEKHPNTKVRELNKDEKHQVGKTYWCGYWNTYYTVTKIDGHHIYCKWQDGHENYHMTSLEQFYDKELIWQ